VGEQFRKWVDTKNTVHRGPQVHTVGGFDVIDCIECGFSHIAPIPTEAELKTIYAHEYYQTDKPLYIESHSNDQEWWNLVYAERYSTIERSLGDRSGRILDVGSGPGSFLLHGKNRGWEVVGVEPSSHAATYSRDELHLDIHEAFLTSELAERLGRFDAVNMALVLEHLPDPVAMLRLVHSILNDEGIVCISVPNDFNPFQLTLTSELDYSPWWIAPPHHINYFNSESLLRLLERTGFEVVHQSASFPIDLFLLFGDNYVGNDSVGKECHEKRKRFEMALSAAGYDQLRQKLYEAMSQLGLGRELIIYAKPREETS